MKGNVGDVLVYDNGSKKVKIVRRSEINKLRNMVKRYTPIGIVAIPSSHNVYGDGSCGVMSLAEMNCTTPTIGSDKRQYMCWGEYSTEVEGLKQLDEVATFKDDSLDVVCEEFGYLPSSTFNKFPNIYDKNIAYETDHNLIPSPYLTDGARNELYSKGERNALADFDGRGNTNKIIAQRGVKDYTTWKPTRDCKFDYPAASCCDMFSTIGTKQGTWYLPSCGEFGYVMVCLKEINDTLNTLKEIYPNVAIISVGTRDYYCMSTECDLNYISVLITYSGMIRDYYKSEYSYVRAFTRI